MSEDTSNQPKPELPRLNIPDLGGETQPHSAGGYGSSKSSPGKRRFEDDDDGNEEMLDADGSSAPADRRLRALSNPKRLQSTSVHSVSQSAGSLAVPGENEFPAWGLGGLASRPSSSGNVQGSDQTTPVQGRGRRRSGAISSPGGSPRPLWPQNSADASQGDVDMSDKPNPEEQSS